MSVFSMWLIAKAHFCLAKNFWNEKEDRKHRLNESEILEIDDRFELIEKFINTETEEEGNIEVLCIIYDVLMTLLDEAETKMN